MADQAEEPNEEATTWWQRALATIVLVALLGVAGIVVVEIIPHHVQNAKNPSFVDNIFANVVVLLFARLALAAAAVYVVVSMFALMGAREWLSEVGPFKVRPRSVEKIAQTEETLRGELEDAVKTIADLNDQLAQSDDQLREAQANVEVLVDYVGRLESKKES